MKLFESILEANHRAIAGDASAGLRPAEFAAELPIVALTCIDPRLNPLFPEILGVPEESFIWLRNAGNIVTGTLSSTVRSLALACAVKGGKEIAIIGHTDCRVCKTTMIELLDRFKALGVERNALPDNLNEYFGLFATERQNVIKGCDLVRRSPLIGAKVPVHGFLVDVETGKLEWLVNGYENWTSHSQPTVGMQPAMAHPRADFEIGEMKFPPGKIGETVEKSKDWLTRTMDEVKQHVAGKQAPGVEPVVPPVLAPKPAPLKVQVPPPIPIKRDFRKR